MHLTRKEDLLRGEVFWDFLDEAVEIRARMQRKMNVVKLVRMTCPALHADLQEIAKKARLWKVNLNVLPIGNLDMQEEIRARFLSELNEKVGVLFGEEEGEDRENVRRLFRLIRHRYVKGGRFE